MIQDISPYRLDMAYHGTAPAPDDCFFSFRGEDVLLRDMGDGIRQEKWKAGRYSCSGRAESPFTCWGRRCPDAGGLGISPSVN